ncbi:MAG: MtnX-like HAD-IB family phosphatase [Bacillota bacterium]
MEKVNYVFFVDFDGTVTNMDACHAMVTNLAGEGWEEINKKWENKELSTVECARQTFKLFKRKDIEALNKIIDPITIDPTFKDLVSYCEKNQFPLYILSDGYDFYIKYLLAREGLNIPYYANRMIFNPDLDIETPYHSSCGICGVCKSQLMEHLQNTGTKSIYIGDGYSDFCPSKKADFVFAKSTLYKHCLAAGKEVHEFRSFGDILKILQSLRIGRS